MTCRFCGKEINPNEDYYWLSNIGEHEQYSVGHVCQDCGDRLIYMSDQSNQSNQNQKET